MASVLAVAHDPGGANVVACVVAELRASGCDVRAVVRGPGRAQFRRLGVGFDEGDVNLDGVDVVLCGTSVGDNLDRDTVTLADKAGVPSVSVLDYWSNYRCRFDVLPDLIVAIDGACLDEMTKGGIPADRVRVLGQPYFGWLIERARPALDPQPVERLLVASEPGNAALDALDAVARAQQRDGLEVTVRFHPREEPRRLGDLRAVVDTDPDPLTSARSHDAVLGLTSTFLIESALQGTPTAAWGHPKMLVQYGFAHPVNGATLATFLDQPQAPAVSAQFIDTQRGAAARVAELVLHLP